MKAPLQTCLGGKGTAVWVLGEREGRELPNRKGASCATRKYDLKKKKTNNQNNLLLWTEIGYPVPGSEMKIRVPLIEYFHLNISTELDKSILDYTLFTGGKCCCSTPILEGLLKIFEVYQGKLGLKCLKPYFSNHPCKKQWISGKCKNSHKDFLLFFFFFLSCTVIKGSAAKAC